MPSSPITTEHFPGPSTYPALSSKRRRHRSTTAAPQEAELWGGQHADRNSVEGGKKGMTIEYYDIHGRLLRLWSDQGDLFLPQHGRSQCEDNSRGGGGSSNSRTTAPTGSTVPVSATASLTRAGRRDWEQGREQEATGVGEFGTLKLRSRSVPRNGVGQGGDGGGSRHSPHPDWLQVPPRSSTATPSMPLNQSQSLPSSSTRRTQSPVSSPPPEKRSQAASTRVQPSTLPSRDAVESKRASSSTSSRPSSKAYRVVLNPPLPPPSLPPPSLPLPSLPLPKADPHLPPLARPPPSLPLPSLPLPKTDPHLPPLARPTPNLPPRQGYERGTEPSSSSTITTATTQASKPPEEQQPRSLRRKPGFVLDRPKTQLLLEDLKPTSDLSVNYIHPDTQSTLSHKRNFSSPPSLIPTIPDVSSELGSTKSESVTTPTSPSQHRRYLSEGNIPNIFMTDVNEEEEGERVDIDGEGARWHNGNRFQSLKGKERAQDDLLGTAYNPIDGDDADELVDFTDSLPTFSTSFWPSEWPLLHHPPSSSGHHIDSNLHSRRKSHSGVLGFPGLNNDFDTDTAEGDRDHVSCLAAVPPLISAFGLGKGHPSFPHLGPVPRERKPTIGRWARRVVVSDPGLLPVPVLSVVDCGSTGTDGQ